MARKKNQNMPSIWAAGKHFSFMGVYMCFNMKLPLLSLLVYILVSAFTPTVLANTSLLFVCTNFFNVIPQDTLSSAFFKGDTTAASILNGNKYLLLESKFEDVASFEYKAVNAVRQLGYCKLDYTDPEWHFGINTSSVAINRFRAFNGLAQSDFMDSATMSFLDKMLRARNILDSQAANKYPPFKNFYYAALNEPSPEHLAMLYSGFFGCLPEDIKTHCDIGADLLLGNIWTVDEFRNSLITGLGSNLGYLMSDTSTKVFRGEELANMLNTHISNFKFCAAEVYYHGYSLDTITNTIIQNKKARVYSDFEYFAALVIHEYGHLVGFTWNPSLGTDYTVAVYFGDISFNTPPFGKDPYPSIVNRRRNDDSEFISGYAATMNLEDFAESFDAYVVMGKIFREKATHNIFLKQKYDFLKKYIFKGREYETGDLDIYQEYLKEYNNQMPYLAYQYLSETRTWVWDYLYPVKNITIVANSHSDKSNVINKINGLRISTKYSTSVLTTIEFDLSYPERTNISIYNLHGNKITSIIEKDIYSGIHKVVLDLINLPTGIYIAKMQSGKQHISRSFQILR